MVNYKYTGYDTDKEYTVKLERYINSKSEWFFELLKNRYEIGVPLNIELYKNHALYISMDLSKTIFKDKDLLNIISALKHTFAKDKGNTYNENYYFDEFTKSEYAYKHKDSITSIVWQSDYCNNLKDTPDMYTEFISVVSISITGKTKEAYKKKYSDYLNSEIWHEKRNKILKRADYKCQKCGNKENLHIHHLNYDRLFNESLSDLICMCKKCHSNTHSYIKN